MCLCAAGHTEAAVPESLTDIAAALIGPHTEVETVTAAAEIVEIDTAVGQETDNSNPIPCAFDFDNDTHTLHDLTTSKLSNGDRVRRAMLIYLAIDKC